MEVTHDRISETRCAPTLAGMKSVSLFTFPFADEEQLVSQLRDMNTLLNGKGNGSMCVSAMAFSAIPVMLAFIGCFEALVGGVIGLYLRLKVQKFGAITLMSAIIGVIMYLARHFWPCMFFGVLSDSLSSAEDTKNLRGTQADLSCAHPGDSADGYTLMLFFAKAFRETRLQMGMTPELIEWMLAVFRGPLLIVAFGGVCGNRRVDWKRAAA